MMTKWDWETELKEVAKLNKSRWLNIERDIEIYKRYQKENATYTGIANIYGLSKARINQIVMNIDDFVNNPPISIEHMSQDEIMKLEIYRLFYIKEIRGKLPRIALTRILFGLERFYFNEFGYENNHPTLNDLRNINSKDLLAQENIGRRTLKSFREILSRLGIAEHFKVSNV